MKLPKIPPIVRERLVAIALAAGLDCAARVMATARSEAELRDVAVDLAGAWKIDAFRAVMRLLAGKELSAVPLVVDDAAPWIAGGPSSIACEPVMDLVSVPPFEHEHWPMLHRVREALYLRGAFLASCERFWDRGIDVWHFGVKVQNRPPLVVVVRLAQSEEPFADTAAKAVAARVVDRLARRDRIAAEDLPRPPLRPLQTEPITPKA